MPLPVRLWALATRSVACATATDLAPDTCTGRYKTIATVGTKITTLTPSKSFATQIGAAVAVLGSSVLGMPVSTSHCLVGSVVGIGLAQKVAGKSGPVNVKVLKRIFIGWVCTIPLAAGVAVLVFLAMKAAYPLSWGQ